MGNKSVVEKPPGGLTKFMLRMPITLYRLGLGWMLGGRFMLLNHIGRKSGEVRQTVIEVVEHDSQTDTYYAVSGWGFKSQWYQNLMVTPDVRIQVGKRKLHVHAETLTPEDGIQILLDYRKKHSMAARELSKVMNIDILNTSPEELKDIIEAKLPVIAFRPT